MKKIIVFLGIPCILSIAACQTGDNLPSSSAYNPYPAMNCDELELQQARLERQGGEDAMAEANNIVAYKAQRMCGLDEDTQIYF
ncbi:hypothetical protein [Flexibacterium corallicola]|uniref:hypothetical protein n=1 Tax=Flexibacterium corallicola TaxID=3037259 RepID=UPI00286F7267|nr:hypothetical protein [Pseudovibrio sp. M1P-2-3]